ncbi:isochorismatase hydrolase [Roseibacterium elongatum DSM 19469]|uniref:Isochorismatase hydrolase n=1 Tax=Roseicyclus elongatus DSM 19469 TaxID=1294273 RepID=W8SSM9_9RHOB|nr:isochorismatase hydrolase [Roseibacterium elongatum DSM 19469]
MPGYKDRMIAARDLVDSAHENNIPVIFIQEVHRPDLIDFGRELDGDEDVHCLEGDPRTEVAKEEMGYRKGDYIVQSDVIRRSSELTLKSYCAA